MGCATAALLGAVLGAASLTPSNAAGQKPQASAKEAAGSREIVMPIDGMSCVACVARVKKELSSLPGVSAVNVDLAGRQARIRFDPTRVSLRQLAAAVNRLGYKAGEPKDAPKEDGK